MAAELASYAQAVEADADPARLAAVQERRAELTRLIRVYGGTGGPGQDEGLAAVLAWAKQAAARVAELDSDDDTIAALAAQEAELAATVADLAGQVTLGREQAAGKFAEQVTGELSALAMPQRPADRGAQPAGRARPARRRGRGDPAGRPPGRAGSCR